jgi:CDP-diacylglycerol--serine O-phosphatidyltransferase
MLVGEARAMRGSQAMRSSKDRMRVRVRRPRTRRRLSDLSVNRMVPNVLTLLALCAGMTAIRFAVNGDFQYAVFAIIAAGVFDGLDGRLARLLKATSQFGAELDSLADFISFGVAPATVLYLWTMTQLHSVGWAIVLFYAVCCALRLARFNTQLVIETPPWAANFFSGAPAPAGAGLIMLPMFISFEWGDWIARSPYVNAVWISGVALMMVSTVPTVSLKRIRIPHRFVIPTLLGIGIMAGFFTTSPWPTLTFVGALYLASIPLTIRAATQARRAAATRQAEPAGLPLPAAAVLPLREDAPPASEWRH